MLLGCSIRICLQTKQLSAAYSTSVLGCARWLYQSDSYYGYKSSIFGDCISSNIWYWE